MRDNQCHKCYKFCRYEDMDSYTPFGCYNPCSPEPDDPTFLCKDCSHKLYLKFKALFEKGHYKIGDWCKSDAEKKAAEECHLTWIGNNSDIQYKGNRAFNEYIPKRNQI